MLWVWIAGYSAVWGISLFSLRYFAVNGVSITSFLPPWYGGAALAGILLYAALEDKGTRSSLKGMSGKDIVLSLALGACILAALWLAYAAFQIAPLVVAQPIFLVAEMIFPALIGLIGFSEGKTYDRFGWACFGLGAVGVCLIALGYAYM